MAAFDSEIEPTQNLPSLGDSAGAYATALNAVYAALTLRLEPAMLLDTALDEILRVTGFSIGGIGTWNETAQAFRMLVQRGWSQDLVQHFEQPRSAGGLRWLAADSGQPLFWQASTPLPNEPATMLLQAGYPMGIFLPLSAPEERLGMLVLLSKTERALGPDEREFLLRVGQLFGIVMRNASLFAEMSRLRKFNERIVQSMDEGIALEDVQGCFTFVNQRFVQVTGYTLQEAIGMHWSQLIVPEEVERARAESGQRSAGVGSRYETLVLTKDGRRLPVLISATPLFEEGRYIGTLSVFSDIYPLKRAEERLRALNAAAVAVQTAHSPDQVFLIVARELGKLELGMAAYLLDSDGQTLQLNHNSLDYKSLTTPVLMPATCRLESVPLFKRILQTHLPALVPPAKDARSSELRNLAIDERLGELGLICAPIVQLDRAIGVLIVGGLSDVTENDLPAVSGFANHIAVALENAALHSSLERQVERLAALHQVSLEVASQLDQEALLQAICEHAVRMLDVNGAGLWMLSPREGVLELIAGYNPAALFIGARLKPGEGIAGRVVDTGRAVVVEDYSRWEGRSPQYPVSKFLGVLGVPLVWGGQVIGALVASDTRQRRAFTSDDIRMLTLFAQQAAVGILNARAYQAEQNRRRLAEILREAAMVLGSHLVLSDVLDLVLEQLGRLISYTSASIALVDEQGWLRLSAGRGFEDVSRVVELTAWPLADDRKAQVILETRQPMIIDDTRQDARWFDVPGVNVRAWIGAPLILGEQVIGILNVDHARPGFYRPEDAETVAIFAGQIVTAIENARLYAEAQRRIQELRGLNQVAHAFSMMRDLSETARIVTEQVAQVLRAEKCWVLLLSPDQREAIGLSPAFGLNEEELTRLRLGTDSSLYVGLRQDNYCLIGDLAELSPAARAMFHSVGMRNMAGAMMRVHGLELGVLLVANRTDATCDPCGFTQDDAIWLAAVATQAAIALDNARLYKDTIHLKTHYQNIIDSTGAVIYTVDRELRLTSFSAEWDRQVARRGLPELIAARLLGQPLLNYVDHPARLAWGAICATILAGGRFEDDNAIYHEQVELNWADGRQFFYLSAGPLQDQVGNIMGIIFTNQDLTAQKDAEQAVWQRTRELSALYAVSTAVSQSLDLTTVLDHALPIITDISGADGVQAFVLDQGRWHLIAHQGGTLPSEAADGNWLPATMSETLSHGEPIIIPDVPQMAEAKAALEAWGMLAQTFIPLRAHGDTAGLLRLGWQRVTLPSDRDVALWLAIGRQIDVAMVNARLYAASEAREREARALYKVARQLTTLDVSRLAESILPQLHDLVDYDIAGMLISREAVGIQLHVASPISQTIAKQFEQRLMEECCSLDLCDLDSNVPVQITWSVPPSAETSGEVIKSFLVAPLSIGARMLGVIMLGSQRGEIYQETHQRTLLTLSNQVAIAVENAWLYQTLRERAQVLERAYADLQEADRLKDELVQNVSHELRTPLTFIRGYVQLLLAGDLGELTPKQHESLDIVARKTDMLTRLVGDIVTLERTKRVGVRAQSMSLAELANLALDTCAATAASMQVTLECELSPTLPLVLGDRDRISEVFDNLLSNALKFTPPGGVITIRAREEAEFVRVEISDTGAGIPSDKLDKIFERFYQVNGSVRRRFGGTGLGLAIVKQIIESHGGKIGVTSQLEVGTTFYFTLPQMSAVYSVVE